MVEILEAQIMKNRQSVEQMEKFRKEQESHFHALMDTIECLCGLYNEDTEALSEAWNKIHALNVEVKELNDLHDLQHKALLRANSAWQKYYNQPKTLPGLTNLINFLVDKAEGKI
jgi:hypothetical protein